MSIPKNDELKGNMHGFAHSSIFKRARELRQNLTETEELLWQELRAKQLDGFKFRRQHPLSKFVLDFYCHKVKLSVELDGEYHKDKEQEEYDKWRTECLESEGITEIRFTNEQVKNDINTVLNEIRKALHNLD